MMTRSRGFPECFAESSRRLQVRNRQTQNPGRFATSPHCFDHLSAPFLLTLSSPGPQESSGTHLLLSPEPIRFHLPQNLDQKSRLLLMLALETSLFSFARAFRGNF